MKAILIDDGRLVAGTLPRPEPGPGEVLVRVQATAVNRADLLQRQGLYPAPPGASPVPGLECSGVVSARGEGVSRWRIGDAVCALLAGGGYAEYACVDARHCLPVPAGLGMAEAACLPEAFATAWLNLYLEAGLQPGERVLLPAGASGVGTAALQLCRLFGSPCFVSVGSQEKLARCLALGATDGVVRGDSLRTLLGTDGVDVILDPVGGASLQEHLGLLRGGGRLALIGLMGGRHADIDLGRLLVKRLRLIGSTLRSRSADEKAALMASLELQVWPHFASGALRSVVDRRFPLAEAGAAHDYVAANQNTGKVALVLEAGAQAS